MITVSINGYLMRGVIIVQKNMYIFILQTMNEKGNNGFVVYFLTKACMELIEELKALYIKFIYLIINIHYNNSLMIHGSFELYFFVGEITYD